MSAVKKEKLYYIILLFSAYVTAFLVIAMVVFLFYLSLPFLNSVSWHSLFSWQWAPKKEAFGLLAIATGSVSVAILAVLCALPIALSIVFITLWAPKYIITPCLALVQLMTAVPTVVYAFAGAMLLVPFLRQGWQVGTGYCWLTASALLALVIVPTMVLMLYPALKKKWMDIHMITAALGMTSCQAVVFCLLPQSIPMLLGVAALGWARAMGDTMIALMLAGNTFQSHGSLIEALRTLTAHIALVSSSDTQSVEYGVIFLGGFFLLIICSGVQMLAQRFLVGEAS